jgi:hypothetical protein
MGQNSQAGFKTTLLNLAGSLGGLLAGLCISLSVFSVLLYLRSEQIEKNAMPTGPATTVSVASAQQEILDLAEAELELGHPQQACVLREPVSARAFAENLWSLATAYDAGGNNRRALEKYQLWQSGTICAPELDRA